MTKNKFSKKIKRSKNKSKKSKGIAVRAKGKTSVFIISSVLLTAVLGGGTYIANSNKLTQQQGKPVQEEKEKVHRQLRLETFYPSPTLSLANDFTDTETPPGTYPDYPSTPLPTAWITTGGCTYTIGFWKNHAGFGPQYDAMSPLLPIWLGTPDGEKSIQVTDTRKAVELLQKNGDASNGINKLYAQMMGSLLNVKSGADEANIPNDEAMAFLAEHNQADWQSLDSTESSKVLQWATDFDEYNNGRAGPSHCP